MLFSLSAACSLEVEAFKILLNIIHGKNSKVPHSLSLEMLAKVSEWVDDLDCYEQVEVFVDIWISQLKKSLPKKVSKPYPGSSS